MPEQDYPHGEILVSAEWLAAHLNDANLKILDGRSGKDYGEGHIPGALLLPTGAFRSTSGDPDNTCTANEFAATAGALGIHPTDTVICYDNAGTASARTWWAFSRFGHADVRFLNGGFRRWQATAQPLVTTPKQPAPATYHLADMHDDLACTLSQVVGSLNDSEVLFWDTRSAGEYSGADPRSNPPERAGHVPHAVNLEWTEMLDPSTGLFKPANEMDRLLRSKGITPEKEVVTYCQGGGRAAHAFLALKLLGYGKAASFDGSYNAYAGSTAPVERS